MGILDKLKAKKQEIQDKYYEKEEKRLLSDIDRAKAEKVKRDRINTLRTELMGYKPNKVAKSKRQQSSAMSFLQNAGQVSLLGSTGSSGKKKKGKKQKSEFGEFGFSGFRL